MSVTIAERDELTDCLDGWIKADAASKTMAICNGEKAWTVTCETPAEYETSCPCSTLTPCSQQRT